MYNAAYGALEISETDFALNPNNMLKLGSGITAAQVKVTGDSAGNLSQAARILHIDRTTLYNKLRRYGLR